MLNPKRKIIYLSTRCEKCLPVKILSTNGLHSGWSTQTLSPRFNEWMKKLKNTTSMNEKTYVMKIITSWMKKCKAEW